MNVALYARYSTDKQDARSIEDQLRRCRAFAGSKGWEVVGIHKDEALSGAHVARPGLQRLLGDAKKKMFEAVIVDDLSRLSRDLGHTWNLIFGDLASRGVRVVDATTGMASDAAGARLTFGALALVNDTFLQLVKTETHRGLEGRALAGFWAGGSCFGYRTIPEPNPQDPEHPRALPVIHEQEAKLVRGLFERYAKGESLTALIAWLNGAGTSAPADGSSKKHGRGWSKSLLYAMLRNERYAGQFVWNRRKWVKDPTTGKRRYVERPEAEWVRTERPELALVAQALWAGVQARHEANARPSNRPRQAAGHLFSGLVRCGVCGGPMSVVGTARFGCSTRHARGETACSNSATISEAILNRKSLAALRTHLASPEVASWLAEVAFAAQARRRGPDHVRKELEGRLAEAEGRVDRLVDTLARMGHSDTVARRVQQEEKQLLDVRAQLARLAPNEPATKPRITADRLLAILSDVDRVAARKPREARAALGLVVESVVVTPQPGAPAKAVLRLKNETAALASGRPFEASSCGGRI